MKSYIFLTSLLLLALSSCGSEKAPPDPLVEQNNESAFISSGELPKEGGKAEVNLDELVYVNASYLFFLEENALKRYDIRKNIIEEIGEPKEKVVSSNQETIFVVEMNSAKTAYQYAFFKPSDELQAINFSNEVDVENLKSINAYWLNNTLELDIYSSSTTTRRFFDETGKELSGTPNLEATNTTKGISPDGQFKAYVDEESCSSSEEGKCLLKIKNLKNNKEVGSVDGVRESDETLWSPDGRYLSYTDFSGPEQEDVLVFDTQTNSTNITKNLSSGERRQVHLLGWMIGNTLLFEYTTYLNEVNTSSLWTYDTKHNEVKQLIAGSSPTVQKPLLVSRDLKTVSYIKSSGELQQIWIANANGTDAQMIYKNYP